jgi:methionyl-tRNA formyltransferase
VRIAIAASPEVAIPTLNALLASEYELVSVITRPDAPAGRGRQMQSSPAAQWAEKHGVVLHKPGSDLELRKLIADLDLVITIGYGVLIPEATLAIPKFGFINLHFSLLPRWRGAAPVQRAIEAGDAKTGVTIFKLDKGMDTGPIYLSLETPLSPQLNTSEVMSQLSELGVKAVLESIELIRSGFSPSAQIDEGASRADKLSVQEAILDWKQPAEIIVRKINAFSPNPGARAIFRGQTLKIGKVRLSDLVIPHGEISVRSKSVYVGTSSSAIELIEVTPAGKPAMSAISWANGARFAESESFS